MDYVGIEEPHFKSFEKEDILKSEDTIISFDTILPDDVWVKIFSFLPVDSIVSAGSVCKRWYEIVELGKYSWNNMPNQKPWYFMLTDDNFTGYIYDLIKNWCKFEFLSHENYNWFISSSCGLVCCMDYYNQSQIFVCNPITRDWKQLPEPPSEDSLQYSALALSVDRLSHDYIVTVVKSRPLPDEFFQWDLAIQIYESKSCVWGVSINEVLVGWRGGNESVICNGILYYLIHSFSESNVHRMGLIMYNLNLKSSCNSLMKTMIRAPCPLTCGRLMNLKNRLVLVGGIGIPEKPNIIEGIGIWELHGKEWEEVTRIPHKFLKYFRRFEDIFASSGAEDLIFVHTYGAPTLFMFDMNQKHWKLSKNYPIKKRYGLQTFTGFCFEPRLEMKP